MTPRVLLSFASLLLLAGCTSHGAAPDASTNPYGSLVDSPVRGLTPEQIEQLETGAGMSLALPAELNGYPGPKHVLELAEELGLEPDQVDEVQTIHDETQQAAIEVGTQIVEKYRELDEAFRSGAIDEADVEALTEEIGTLEGDLRSVHLRAHLRTQPILSDHQRAMYVQLRGYGEADHGAHDH